MTDDTSVKTNVARSTTARVFNPAPSARAPQPATTVATTATTVVPPTQADDASLPAPQPLPAAGQQVASTPPSPTDQQVDLSAFPTQEPGQDVVQSQDHQDFFGLTDDAAGGAADLASRYDLNDDDGAKKTGDIDSAAGLSSDLLSDDSLPAAPSTDAPEGKKNPLDVLEELLNQANEATSGKEAAPDPEAEKAKESELIRKELEEKAKKQAIVDQQLIEVQRAALEEDRQHGSASQARTQQEDAKQQDRQSKAAASDGFEIDQLGHTKI